MNKILYTALYGALFITATGMNCPAQESTSTIAVNSTTEEELIPCVTDGKTGFCHADGSTAIRGKYNHVTPFSEGLALVHPGWKLGFIDKTGREFIPPKYDNARSFSEGVAAVNRDGKWGFINKTGLEIVPPKYDNVDDFHEGLASIGLGKFGLGGKYGFIDKTGREVIPLKYDSVHAFSDGLALVELGKNYMFIDKTGQEVIPIRYDWVGSFSEGLVQVVLDGKDGFIDGTGQEVVPPKYHYTLNFSEGLARVSLDGKYGFIDRTGREVVPLKYDDAGGFQGHFSKNLARVSLGKKWGYIDKTGREVIPLKYNGAGDFVNGFAWVHLGEKSEHIDKWGRSVYPGEKTDSIPGFVHAEEPEAVTQPETAISSETAMVAMDTETAKIAAEWAEKQKVPAEVIQVANEGFSLAVRTLPDEHISKEWGVTSESLRTASLGEPFREYQITLAALRNYHKGDTVESLLSERDLWHFPVLVNNEIKIMLWVGRRVKGANLEIAGWGGSNLVPEFDKIMRQWPKSKGYNPVFIEGAHYGWFFTIPEKDSYNLTLIPTSHYIKEHTTYPGLDTVDATVEWLNPIVEESARSWEKVMGMERMEKANTVGKNEENPALLSLEPTTSTFHITLVETGKDVLTDQDIESYNWTTHKIKLNKDGIAKWNSYIVYNSSFNPPIPVLGGIYKKDFVVRIDEKEIYRGKFWSMASSASFDGVIILDTLFPLDNMNNSITINYGYPSPSFGSKNIRDPRNNPESFDFFKKKNLLKINK